MDKPVVLHVSNIPYNASAEELSRALNAIVVEGVRKCEIRTKVEAGIQRSKGFGFVTVESEYVADRLCVLAARNSVRLFGRTLRVKRSTRGVDLQPTYTPIIVEHLKLQFGNLITENQLKPIWQSDNMSVTLEFTFETHTLSVKVQPLLDGENKEYKLDFKLRDIEMVESAAPYEGESSNAPLFTPNIRRPRAIFFRAHCPPHVYWRNFKVTNKVEDGLDSDSMVNFLASFLESEKFFFSAADTEVPWTRGTDFTEGSVIGRAFHYLLALTTDNTLQDIVSLGNVMENLVDYGLAKDPPIPKILHVLFPEIIGYNLPFELVQQAGLLPEFSSLPYCVLFKILQMVLNVGKFSGHNMTSAFVDLLTRLPQVKIMAALRNIQEDEEITGIFDPVGKFLEVVEGLPGTRFLARKIDPGKLSTDLMYVHRVLVTPTKAHCLGPEVDSSNRVTREYCRLTDNFLRVSFVDEHLDDLSPQALTVPVRRRNLFEVETNSDVYYRILDCLSNGIHIGVKHFQFLAFSTSQLREQSVWMFSPSENVTPESIRKWMGDFFKIQNVAKCAARMGQCFSSSRPSLDVQPIDRTTIPDIEIHSLGKYNFSDGIGTISLDFASEVWDSMGMRGRPMPSAFQIRYAGAKGVVAIHPLSRRKLCLRKSMQKFSSDHCGFDVLDWSRFRPGFLNRQIITLLSTLGVQDSVLLSLQDVMVKELDLMLEDSATAIRMLEAFNSGDSQKPAVDMLSGGFHPGEEPHLQAILRAFRAVRLLDLKTKARVFVPKARCLMGCLDEFGDLEYGEVFLQVTRSPQTDYQWSDGLDWPRVPNSSRHVPSRVVVGKVVVAKCPCLHPGDARVFNAVNVPRLHHMVDCLVFPQKGHRPHPNECSGSDLDGDLYFVSWDERLIPMGNATPMDYNAPDPVLLGRAVEVKDIAKFFVDYMMNNSLGVIANAHVVHADKSSLKANDPKCLELAKLFSTAVDFPKTGIPAVFPSNLRPTEYPDFMEKDGKDKYESESILGKLYRKAKTAVSKDKTLKVWSDDVVYDPDLEVPGFMKHVEDAEVWKSWYDQDIIGLMNQYGIKSEAEVVTGHILTLNRYYQKRQGEVKDRVRRSVAVIRKRARFNFDGGEEILDTKPFWPVASAWYYVTYGNRKNIVDGREKGRGKARLMSFPWVLSDVLSEIKMAALQFRKQRSQEISGLGRFY